MMLISGYAEKPLRRTRQTSCEADAIQQYLNDNNLWEEDTPRRERRRSLYDQESFGPFELTDPYKVEFMTDSDLMKSGIPAQQLERARKDMRQWPRIR